MLCSTIVCLKIYYFHSLYIIKGQYFHIVPFNNEEKNYFSAHVGIGYFSSHTANSNG